MNHPKLPLMLKATLFTLCLVFVGCTTSAPAPTTTREAVSAINTVIASSMPPTATLIPSTPVPSLTFTPTPSLTPTTTPIPLPTATLTPQAIPTPPGVDTLEQVLWLYETNNGCQLPCWWGITPGQTEWSVAEEFLHRFDPIFYEASGIAGEVYYGISIPLLPEIFVVDHTELGIIVSDGRVKLIFADIIIGDTTSDYFPSYTLPIFLTTHGQPGEVWLFTYPSPYEQEDLPFIVVLFYPEQGIVALYGDNGEVKGDIVEGCPQEDIVSFLRLGPTKLNLTFEQTITGTSALERDYLPLEEATEIDVATFYETFRQPDNTTCLETPANLWR